MAQKASSKAYDVTSYERDPSTREWAEEGITEVQTHDPQVLRERLRELKRKGVMSRILTGDDDNMTGYYANGGKIEYVYFPASEDEEE